MKLDGEYVLDAKVQEVWDALFDPAVLAACLPGCDKLELVEGAYLGELKVKVGPVQGKFTGKVDLLDKMEPRSYRMVIDGRGAQGFVKATATLELSPEGDGGGAAGEKTRLKYQSESQIGGKIATVGLRLVEAAAKAIVKQSLEGLNENIKIRAEAYRAAAGAEGVKAEEAAAAAEPTTAAEPESATAAGSATATAPASAPASAPATAPAPEPEAEPEAEPETNPVAASDDKAAEPAVVAASKPGEAPKPEIQYKRADATKMASAATKEVAKTLAPTIVMVVVVLAAVGYLLFLR